MLLEYLLSANPFPRWTETVRSEILAGIGQPECDNLLAAPFLGAPHQIEVIDLAEVVKIQIRLGGGIHHPTAQLGEAESIFVADRLNGSFVTDDYAAYDFARRYLGDARVFDTIDLLREAVATGYMTGSEAQQVADAIRNSGRKLRRGHPTTFPPRYFE
jgi:hypothetical protein